MTESTDLLDLIRADARSRGQTVSRMGYFCAPFRPASGPYADKVIKVYRGLRDPAALARLARNHDDYVAVLRQTGVPFPETRLHLLALDGGQVPVIVQQALPSDSMMRKRMIEGSLERTLEDMQAAGEVIARFWNAAQGMTARVGFHPSIRNFAIIDGQAVFFDSFPPLIDYSRDEMGRLLLEFSDKRLMRLLGPLLRRRVTGIQDEWYSASETLIGMVGSACRLRPDDAAAYLDWGRGFAPQFMPRWAEEIEAGLQTPPRLPGYWTGMRRVLGLQGAPNLN